MRRRRPDRPHGAATVRGRISTLAASAAAGALALAAAGAPTLAAESRTAQRSPSGSSAAAMTGEEITQTFAGQEVAGVYNEGTAFTEDLRADGTTQYSEPTVLTDGRWWVTQDAICFEYEQPLDTGCFRIWQRSQNCYDQYFLGPVDARGSIEVPPLAEQRAGLSYDSRFWRVSEPSTCALGEIA